MEPQVSGWGKDCIVGVLVFFTPFHSKAFLHMTQTSLNFPKLQSLPMAQPQSGGKMLKRKKDVCKPAKHCVFAP